MRQQNLKIIGQVDVWTQNLFNRLLTPINNKMFFSQESLKVLHQTNCLIFDNDGHQSRRMSKESCRDKKSSLKIKCQGNSLLSRL